MSDLKDFEVEGVTALFARVRAIESLTREQAASLWREFSQGRDASWLELSDERIRAFSEWAGSSPASRRAAGAGGAP